jgi:hypothetical protein
MTKPAPTGFFLRSLAVLGGLWAFAVSHPVLDLVARNPQFLGVHDLGPADLVMVVVAAFTAIPALAALALAGVAAWRRRPADVLLGALSALLTAAALRPVLGRLTPWPGWVQISVALAAAALGTLAMARWADARRRLAWLGVLPLVLAVVFLVQPGPRSILLPPDQATSPAAPGEVPPPPAPRPVVLVIFDALPLASLLDADGGIDAGWYPNLAAFAGDAAWHRNTHAVSPSTLWAVPAILSGAWPAADDQPNLDSFPDNIFTWLAPTHAIHAFEAFTHLDPAGVAEATRRGRLALTLEDLGVIGLHVILPADLARGLPPVTNDWKGFARLSGGWFASRNRFDAIEDFIGDLGRAGESRRPGAYVLHAVLPHGPARALPSGSIYLDEFNQEAVQGDQWGRWNDDPWAVIGMHQRYLAQTRCADTVVGRIVAALKAAGIYDEAVVVICSDHGMGFVPGDERRGVTATNQGEILPVPFLVRAPGGPRGVVDDEPRSNIEVLPTIAAALGTRLPWPAGEAPGDSASGDPNRGLYLTAEGWRATDIARVNAQRDEAAARRRRLFGPGTAGNLHAPLRGRDLLGQPLPAALPGLPGWSVSLDQSPVRPSPDSDAGTVPALVCGYLSGTAPLPDSIDLAVAVDDTIRALTRPFGRQPAGDLSLFATLVPETCVGPGEHRFSVIAVDRGQERPVLLSLDAADLSICGPNLANSPLPGVTVFGLHAGELWNGAFTAWTDGTLNIFAPPPRETLPRALDLDLAMVGNPDEPLIAVVNGTPVGVARCGPGPWRARLPIEGIDAAGPLRVALLSGAFVPAERNPATLDRRTLGVALRSVSLVAPSDTTAAPPAAPGLLPVTSVVAAPDPGTGVKLSGFFEMVRRPTGDFAWTSGDATMEVPWPGPEAPQFLVLSMDGGGDPEARLVVDVNGVQVADYGIRMRHQVVAFPLDGVPPAGTMTIRLRADTFVQAEVGWSDDMRRLGVALYRVTLLAAGPRP